MVVLDRLRGICATAVVVSFASCLLLGGCSSATQNGSAPAPRNGSTTASQNGPTATADSTQKQATEYQVIYDKSLINFMGFPDAATIVEDSMRGYDPETDDVLIDCVAMDDGTAVVTFNAEQLVKKKQWLMERIAVELKYHTEVNPFGKIELSSDFRTLDIYVNEYEALEALPGWGGVLNGARAVSAYCGQLQILDHPGDSSWDITWNIYNPESGKLVVSGDPRTGAITYDEQTWAASR